MARFSKPRLESRPRGWERLISPVGTWVLWTYRERHADSLACRGLWIQETTFTVITQGLSSIPHLHSPHLTMLPSEVFSNRPRQSSARTSRKPRQNFTNFSAEVSLTGVNAGPRAVEMKFLSSLSFYLKNSCEIPLYVRAYFNINVLFSSNIQNQCAALRSCWEARAGW